MRKLATIRIVDDIRPIDGADAIELAVFGGWQVVVRKAQEIISGMQVVYCEIDSIFPEEPQYEFLRQDKFRLRTKKFRGALSQGVVFKIGEVLPTGEYAPGDDITDLLGVTLYEQPVPASIGGCQMGAYPRSVPKTEEERVQNIDLGSFVGMSFYTTEKVDGTSCSFILDEARFHVCGRNWEFRENDDQTFWKLARQYDIEAKLRKYHEQTGCYLAIQGEVIGPGIQGNIYALGKHDLFVFNIFDVTRQRYLPAAAYTSLLTELGLRGVPVVETQLSIEGFTHASLLSFAEGKSLINPQKEREGVVFRSFYEMPSCSYGKISFKAISNKFLLNQ